MGERVVRETGEEAARYPLRMVAWELTRNCNLDCVHCRARAGAGPYDNELTLEECTRIIDDIAGFASPTIILTGGEPLLRKDIYDIIAHAVSRGFVRSSR